MVDSTEVLDIDEAWETESGLLDEYVGTVTRSYFSTDANYMGGTVMLLHWVLATNNVELPEIIEKFPIGGGWDSRDGGDTVAHEGGRQKFHKSSMLGKILDRVTKADGNLHDAAPTLKSRGRPTDARVWNGTTWQFKREDFNYGGDIGTKSRVVPVKFLGENAQVPLAATNGHTPAPAATAPAAAPTAAAETVEVEQGTKSKLVVAAKTAADHGDFLNKAMEIEGVPTNEALFAQVIDDGPSGFYAQARA